MENKEDPVELEAAIAEFQALRQEALHYIGERRHLLNLFIIISSAVLGFASQFKSVILACLPMFLAPGCMFMCLVGFNAPQRIGAYVRTFIEGRHRGFNWELALRDAITREGGMGRLSFGNRFPTLAGYAIVYATFAILSCVLTFAYGPLAWALPLSLGGMALVIAGLGFLVYFSLYGIRMTWADRFDGTYLRMFGKPPGEQRTDLVPGFFANNGGQRQCETSGSDQSGTAKQGEEKPNA